MSARKLWGVLMIAALALWAVPGPAAQAQQAPTVHIDPLPFQNSVPHQMTLGHSYRVIVVVVNNGTRQQACTVVMDFPQGNFFTTHPVTSFEILPGNTEALNFTLVATDISSAPLTVSALLVVTVGLQQQTVQRVTATVYSIDRDPLVYTALYLGGAAIVSIALVAVVLVRRSNRRRTVLGPDQGLNLL